MMMTNERKIWEAALLLVRRHGSEAVGIAEREAGLTAALLLLTLFTVSFAAQGVAYLIEPEGREIKAP